MSRIVHMCVSIRGLLRQSRREFARTCKSVTHEGRPVTPDQFREYLMDELANGHEVLPYGEPCEGFSYVDGCPGHEVANDI